MSDKYPEGYDAYCEGKKKNPYKGVDAAEWLRGWLEAKRISETPIKSNK